MSLWKRGNVWWAFFYIDGVRYQASTGSTNRRQAELIEDKLRQEAVACKNGLVAVDSRFTFGQLAARFIAEGGPHRHHLHKLKLLLPYFADIPVSRITRGIVRDYRNSRHSQKRLTEATVNRDVSVLRHLFYWAVEEGMLASNPLARVPMARERRFRRPVVSLEEEQALLTAAPPHLQRLVIAALDTGMRRGELLHQLWEHVDFGRRVLFVTKSKTPEGEAREIPLSQRVFNLLWDLREDQGPIFTYRGHPIQTIKTAWKASLRRAVLRHIRFHDLRHTFNTRLMEAGVLQEVRMALMGHSGGSRVHALYTHVELPIKREAIHKLELWQEFQHETQKKGEQDAGTAGQPQGLPPGRRYPLLPGG